MSEVVERCCKAQEKYCEEKGVPHFAPRDGRCWSCSKQIYGGENGYGEEYAASRLVTGCPHCHRSYCS